MRVSYSGQSVQSAAMEHGASWYEDLAVPIVQPIVQPRDGQFRVSRLVQITLWDKDRISRDDVVGVAYIDLADVPERGQDGDDVEDLYSKKWGVPTWVDLYGAPAHVGHTSADTRGKGSNLLQKLGRLLESEPEALARKMNR